MVARATAVTTHRLALAATSTWDVPKYPADSTDCLPSHMAQTHKHDTMSRPGARGEARTRSGEAGPRCARIGAPHTLGDSRCAFCAEAGCRLCRWLRLPRIRSLRRWLRHPALPKYMYPADSTDCLPSHMTYRHTGTQTHRHDTGLSHGPQSRASDTETCTGR
jgi:hypothetical protein